MEPEANGTKMLKKKPKIIKPVNNEYRDFKEFMFKHLVKKGDDSKPITHTRIGGNENGELIYGGSYHIPNEEKDIFMKLYYQHVIVDKNDEFLTEKQIADKCPIAIDIDLHFALDIKERVYSKEHIDDLRDIYLEELKQIFQFDDDTKFRAYVYEKKNMNRVKAKDITKDGIHIIFGIQMSHTAQLILRNRVIPKVEEAWGDFPIVNKWTDVFDERISNGGNNWQMLGSRKPEHEAYQLSIVYDIQYDSADNEFSCKTVKTKMTEDLFKAVSVRNDTNPQYFYTSNFTKILNEQIPAESKSRSKTPNVSTSSLSSLDTTGGGWIGIRNIRNQGDLEHMVNQFLDSIIPSQYILRETHDYTMTLPEQYYGSSSYDKWIRVGWALKNTSERLLITWIAFSAKYSKFDYKSIPDLCDKWDRFTRKDQNGVTERSIMYWSMQDNPSEFKKVKQNTISFHLDQTINTITVDNVNSENGKNAKGCGDYDIARVLYELKKSQFKCISVKHGIWYEFRGHRWVENDSGTTLRKSISEELRDLYLEKAAQMMQMVSGIDPENEKAKTARCRVAVITNICNRLGKTTDKKNIMTEAKDLFRDENFMQLIDNNPYLLCFNNGVYDFKANVFRKGLPEDYLTKCTNIDYVAKKDPKIVTEINDFMDKLFPRVDLRRYMWDHLASALVGTSSLNQTFNIYIGGGQNGKSVLTDLMSQVLGNYKVAVPVALITQQRGKIGGLAPEIVAMKGTRYAVMQEPSKGDRINEGILKELVSGVEPIKARAPYMLEPIEFIPQFKLVMCSNELPEIKTQDHGTWRRIRVDPFESLFTENPVLDDPEKPYQFLLDRNIKERFEDWRQVFAAMLIEVVTKTQGKVEDCDIVLSASKDYRARQDYLSEFVSDKIARDPKGMVRKSQLTDEFKLWFATNNGGKANPKDMHEYMDKTFGKQRNGMWHGIRIKFREDEYEDCGSMATTNDVESDTEILNDL
jgi:P4 family phage/plasmid primase-like protien